MTTKSNSSEFCFLGDASSVSDQQNERSMCGRRRASRRSTIRRIRIRREAVASLLAVYAISTTCHAPSGGAHAFSSNDLSRRKFVLANSRVSQSHSATQIYATIEDESRTQDLAFPESYFVSDDDNDEEGHYGNSQFQFEGVEPFYADKMTTIAFRPSNGKSNGHSAKTIMPPTKSGASKNPVMLVNEKKPTNGVHQPTGRSKMPPLVEVDSTLSHEEEMLRVEADILDSLSGFDGSFEFEEIETGMEEAIVLQPDVATNATTSRIRRAFKSVRNVCGKLSPMRILTSNHENSAAIVDKKEEQRKQTREEAMVARMSRKKKKQLSNLLKNVNRRNTKSMAGITSRTLTGLISALAEEAENLSVSMTASENTPIWRKQVDVMTIEFSRLGFKPLHMGSPDQLVPQSEEKNALRKTKPKAKAKSKSMAQKQKPTAQQRKDLYAAYDDDDSCPVEYVADANGNILADISCADTAFQTIDADNSGALDKDEIADALVLAATSAGSNSSLSAAAQELGASSRKVMQRLAKQLVDLYDTNDDGVIDRMEYQSMVEDMAALRQVQKEREEREKQEAENDNSSWWSSFGSAFLRGNDDDVEEGADLDEALLQRLNRRKDSLEILENATATEDPGRLEQTVLIEAPETMGRIVLENVKLDLRQMVFGAIPLIKRITPGGPLFLEPFKVTAIGSFTAEDIMKSSLLDMGLRQLVSFALRVRVRSFRDLMDGAVFYGRKWKRGSVKAPLVECTELQSVEIDDKDRLIITGRAKIRTNEDAPVIDNSFKLRTKVATPRNGRAIKLSEPEIAIVLECPQALEKRINATFASLKMKTPSKPKPIYTYIPIHSPFKKDDDTGGYYMGEDNQIKSLSIQDKCLRFEMETILRPGKFLGSHFLAFTVPQRSLIITVDRVKEGMRAARKTKRALQRIRKARAVETDRKAHHAEDALNLDDLDFDLPSKNMPNAFPKDPKQEIDELLEADSAIEAPAKGFISRFVDGYLQAGATEENKERLAHAISDWFGRQGVADSRPDDTLKNSVADVESPQTLSEVSTIVRDIATEE